MAEGPAPAWGSEMAEVLANTEAERAAAAVMCGRPKPVPSGELNPGSGEYLEQLPPGPAGTGGQVGDGKDVSMTTILVPLDGAEAAEVALPVARWLAEGLHATVVLVTVGPDPESAAQASEEYAALEHALAHAGPALRSSAVRRRIQIANDPVAGILDAAREERPDLIVMATHGRTGWSELVQGSVAEAVVRAGVAPVTLVPRPDRG